MQDFFSIKNVCGSAPYYPNDLDNYPVNDIMFGRIFAGYFPMKTKKFFFLTDPFFTELSSHQKIFGDFTFSERFSGKFFFQPDQGGGRLESQLGEREF